MSQEMLKVKEIMKKSTVWNAAHVTKNMSCIHEMQYHLVSINIQYLFDKLLSNNISIQAG